MSTQPQTLAALTLVPITLEVGWPPNSAWKLRVREKSLFLLRIELWV
jgi:hypothetical protein